MEPDSKNKHRISDARWRDSVARCYNLLRACSNAEQESTRMAILRLTLQQIQEKEADIFRLGRLNEVKSAFGKFESASRRVNN
jgi:transcriptional regulator of aromatic amino acid metabolism